MIRSPEQSRAIRSLINRRTSERLTFVAFGIIRVNSSNFAYLDGGLVSTTGRPGVNYRNWAAGEPNNLGGSEDCGTLYPTGKWNDNSCTKRYHFVCERGEIK